MWFWITHNSYEPLEVVYKSKFGAFNSPLSTSSLTLFLAVPATLVTEQLYTPASLSARLLISSCDLPVLLMTLLPPPRRNTLPSFSQRTSGAGTPVKEHTNSKWLPSLWVVGAGRDTMVGWAVKKVLCMSLCNNVMVQATSERWPTLVKFSECRA